MKLVFERPAVEGDRIENHPLIDIYILCEDDGRPVRASRANLDRLLLSEAFSALDGEACRRTETMHPVIRPIEISPGLFGLEYFTMVGGVQSPGVITPPSPPDMT